MPRIVVVYLIFLAFSAGCGLPVTSEAREVSGTVEVRIDDNIIDRFVRLLQINSHAYSHIDYNQYCFHDDRIDTSVYLIADPMIPKSGHAHCDWHKEAIPLYYESSRGYGYEGDIYHILKYVNTDTAASMTVFIVDPLGIILEIDGESETILTDIDCHHEPMISELLDFIQSRDYFN